MKFTIKENDTLLKFLLNNLEQSKNNVKSILTNKNVTINGKVVTQHDHILKPNDIVEIIKKTNNEIEIIYEDNDIIVVNKPYNLLTISTEKEKEKTLYRYMSDYLKIKNKKSKIFVVHRLDKETSGVVVFAKNEKTKELLQNNWNEIVTRKYIAIVEGKMQKKNGEIKSFLKENKGFKTYSSNNGDLAITQYTTLKTNDTYSLLEIIIKTGKKNQIRVHLSDINHKIIGDKKYNSTLNPINRMGLHALELKLVHPITKKQYTFSTTLPKEFVKLSNNMKNFL